jgi:hypothetical protein
MSYLLMFSAIAERNLERLTQDAGSKKILKAVLKTLALMQTNLRHPSLNTHEYHTFLGPSGEKVFEAYAQNRTPGAYRVFWYYGPGKGVITILAIMAHP